MKKNKIIWVIILSILVLNLTGCGSNTDDNTENNTTTTTSKVEPTEDNGVPIYNGIGFTDSGVLKPYEEETYEDAIIITDVNNKLIYEDNGFSITIASIKQNVKTLYSDDKNNILILLNINNATSDKILLIKSSSFGFHNFKADNIHYSLGYSSNRPVNIPPGKIQKNADLLISYSDQFNELNLLHDVKKISFELTYSSADYVTDEIDADYYIRSPEQIDKYDASKEKTVKFVIDMESVGYYKPHEEIYQKENMYKLESNEIYDSYLYDLYPVSVDGKYDFYGKVVVVGKKNRFGVVAVHQVKVLDDKYTAGGNSSFAGIDTICRSYFYSNGSFESIPDTIKLGVGRYAYSKEVTSWVTIKKVNEILEKFNEIHGRESNYVEVLR